MKILDIPRSGSYGGVTSSRNRFGQYVRTRATPVNPATTFQQAVRSRLSTAAQEWRLLTSTQREGWQALGEFFARTDALGQTYGLTGFQCYVSVRSNLVAAGDTVLSDAPLYAPPDALTSITPTISAASVSLAYTPTPLAAGERIFWSLSTGRSAGRSFEGDTRLVSVTAAAAASPSSILTSYQGRFGTPVTGQRVFVVGQRYKGGFLSTPLITSVIVS
jgi:hypothetical protein